MPGAGEISLTRTRGYTSTPCRLREITLLARNRPSAHAKPGLPDRLRSSSASSLTIAVQGMRGRA